MSFLSILTMILRLMPGLFVVRQLKILCEGDVERFQVVRAVALVTMLSGLCWVSLSLSSWNRNRS
jgi:hypothetical protein